MALPVKCGSTRRQLNLQHQARDMFGILGLEEVKNTWTENHKNWLGLEHSFMFHNIWENPSH